MPHHFDKQYRKDLSWSLVIIINSIFITLRAKMHFLDQLGEIIPIKFLHVCAQL